MSEMAAEAAADDDERVMQLALKIDWPETFAGTSAVANQFALHGAPGPEGQLVGLYLTLGSFTPPVIAGTPAEQHAKVDARGPLPIEVLTQVFLTPEHARQLFLMLGSAIEQSFPGLVAEGDGDD